MKKFLLIVVFGALLAMPVMAQWGPPCGDPYRGSAGGVRLASDIVNLVGSALNIFQPTQVVVAQPTVVAQPVVYQQPVVQQTVVQYAQPYQQTVVQYQQPVVVETIPAYTYSYYNNTYVPYYNGYYYYGNRWCWGRPGPAPYYAPRWNPRPYYGGGGYRGGPAPMPRGGGYGPGGGGQGGHGGGGYRR